MSKLYPLIVLALGGGFLTAGDVVFKLWTFQGKPVVYLAGLALYVIGLLFLVESYKYTNIAAASAIFVIFNLLFLGLVTWIWFKEPLSYAQIIGLSLAVVAIVLLEQG